MIEFLQAFYGGLSNILPFTSQGQQAFFFMLVGIFVGFWVGILPGLGRAATLARVGEWGRPLAGRSRSTDVSIGILLVPFFQLRDP
jgi:hypothetical protein